MLFEVAIIEKPTKKQKDDGASEKLMHFMRVIAPDENAAGIIAAKDMDVEIAPDRMVVLVRPFCED